MAAATLRDGNCEIAAAWSESERAAAESSGSCLGSVWSRGTESQPYQRGRGFGEGQHRLHPSKTEVRICDYVERSVPMLMKMFEKRLRGYRAIGYARGEEPLGIREGEDETVIEYDDEPVSGLDDDP